VPPVDALDNIVVVLHQPRKLANIGGAIRAMKNMGLRRLRLVQPAAYDPDAIEGIAHRSADLRATIEIHEQLDTALADAIYIVGATARPRDQTARVATPRELAPELLARAAAGPVVLLFGPEDAGLTNAELDRCHCFLTIPAEPGYSSLNLAHAVLLVAYELRQVHVQPQPDALRHTTAPPSAAQLEQLFDALERALWGIEFFKAQRSTAIMRRLRHLVHRAEPSAREVALLRAIFLEIVAFLHRRGIVPGARE
jgi:tRNA/rRNA methyltransferase/tRNA (cytidine32/uridine32-2'-O)-methyltransferase